MDEPSVMATENALMAAALTPGATVIRNAACEPHVQDLARMLVAMGAAIDGIGSNVMTVHGVTSLRGCTHTIAPVPPSRKALTITTVSGRAQIGVFQRRLGVRPARPASVLPASSQRRGTEARVEPQQVAVGIGNDELAVPRLHRPRCVSLP